MQKSISNGSHDLLSTNSNIEEIGSPWPFDSNVKIIDLTHTCMPPLFDVDQRMEMLSSMLSDPKLSHQRDNIEAVMPMYKTGATPTTNAPWWFVNGKFLEQEPELEQLPYGCSLFVEKPRYQIMQASSSPPVNLRTDYNPSKPD
ncbi:hypothetical protein ABVK25_000129 [Lepraria finkii]|uniref:Uncharacterized protein n=1 Tax=Lepraria finkii TaxID=1340010 RepID=A0ABR4BM07_9LECA